ncbi:hypothetical protein ROHU_022687 [Labeo rohita]|uniref:Uncharacterized protein n=1 Tax=Labeo rohita TaxID=84645 RepID=A0A498MQ66_LABRO|nr:hypothetical protein ROHU_022687 [Labeo rohita]
MTRSGTLQISGIFPPAVPSVGGETPQGRVPAADYSTDPSFSSRHAVSVARHAANETRELAESSQDEAKPHRYPSYAARQT